MMCGGRCVKAPALAANRRTGGTTTKTGEPSAVVDSVLEGHASNEDKEASVDRRDAAAEPASSAPAIRVITTLIVMVSSPRVVRGLLADGRTADLVIDQEAARVTNLELGGGLAVFNGNLYRSLLGAVCGAGAGQ
jgi:hypothetical protein